MSPEGQMLHHAHFDKKFGVQNNATIAWLLTKVPKQLSETSFMSCKLVPTHSSDAGIARFKKISLPPLHVKNMALRDRVPI
jgi:hypothetical protein